MLLTAFALTGLNLYKPLVIDDGIYVLYAQKILEAPTDPYGFDVVWRGERRQANHIIAPPVMLYSLAGVMAWVGDSVVAWKAAFLFYALLLSGATWLLLRRFAAHSHVALLVLAILSPVVLPSFNLMLDVPMIAIALGALVLLFEAADRAPGGAGWAIAGGLVGGLAMQTKYNAFVPVSIGLLHLGLVGGPRRMLLAGGFSAFVFVSWEAFVASLYGESHFLSGVTWVVDQAIGDAAQWAWSFVAIFALSMPAIALLAMAVVGVRARWRVAAATGFVLLIGVMGLARGDEVSRLGWLFVEWRRMSVIEIGFGCVGVSMVAICSLALWRDVIRPGLDRVRRAGLRDLARDPEARLDWLLLAFVAVEIWGFVAFPPFPALRRVLGLYFALVFLLGRLVSRRAGSGVVIRGAAALGACLGLFFAVTDLTDARVQREGIDRLVARLEALRPPDDEGRVVFTGRWGFRHYALAAGFELLEPNGLLRQGDWLIVPESTLRHRVRIPPEQVERVETIRLSNPWPWSTLPGAYAGERPLRPQFRYQVVIHIDRVLEEWREP